MLCKNEDGNTREMTTVISLLAVSCFKIFRHKVYYPYLGALQDGRSGGVGTILRRYTPTMLSRPLIFLVHDVVELQSVVIE